MEEIKISPLLSDMFSEESFQNAIDTADEKKLNRKLIEIYKLFKEFKKKMVLDGRLMNLNVPKCQEWKDAYKGSGAYWTLKNMIMFHDCLLPKCPDKETSLQTLELALDSFSTYNEVWRFHKLLKETIEYNGFVFGK